MHLFASTRNHNEYVAMHYLIFVLSERIFQAFDDEISENARDVTFCSGLRYLALFLQITRKEIIKLVLEISLQIIA